MNLEWMYVDYFSALLHGHIMTTQFYTQQNFRWTWPQSGAHKHLWQSHAKNKNKAMCWNYPQFSFTYNCTFALFIPTLEHLEIGVSLIISVWILWLQQLVNIFWDVCSVWDARALRKVYCLLFFRKWDWKGWTEVERESRRQKEGKKQIM